MRRWRESKNEEPPDTCYQCFVEQVNNKVDDFKRRDVLLPCPTHGDPRDVMPVNAAWIELYEMIAPYHDFREKQAGDQIERHPILNLAIVRLFAEELGLNFFEMLETLTLIHRGLYG